MFKLIRHFSLMSAIAIVAITTALAVGFYTHQMRSLKRSAEERNLDVARVITSIFWSRYSGYVLAGQHGDAEQLRQNPVTRLLDVELREIVKDVTVAKIKIYTPDGLTIYSSDFAQIGESKADDKDFLTVVQRQEIGRRTTERQKFVGFAGVTFDRHMAETYVPVVVDGRVVGVFEAYSDITDSVAAVHRDMRSVVLFGILALGALYGLLLLIIRRADRILKLQYRRLETFSSDLEMAVDNRTRQLVNQHSVSTWIIRSEAFRQGSLDDVARLLTKSSAGTIGVERASIWLYNSDRSAINCADLYEAVSGKHSAGLELPVTAFPAYFAAMETDEIIAADNALTDPRTREFAESYLKPLGIGAMLDAPIMQDGEVVGVLCCEIVGEPRVWTAEQRLFAVAIANMMALTLERLERRQAEESLTVANARAQSATKAKSMFLANMSHEIRTPMNGVFGMTDLLLRTELTERQQRLAHTIQRSARSLLTIINDILDISRIEAGKLALDAHEFDPRDAIEETVDLLAEEADRKAIGLSLYVCPQIPAGAIGDVGRVRQVATNLISNAIKFTRSGEVAVRLETRTGADGGKHFALQVKDTGVGIPVDVQERLFQPFHQADTSITRRFGGTGLGLSISRHLIEMMGGTITLDSTVGVGTRITAEWPMKPAADAGARAAVRREEVECIRGKRVLVLDDRATNREILIAYLQDAGAVPTGVAHADDALALLRGAAREGEPYAAALIDMVMPTTTGLEVGRRIKADPAIAETKLLMVTSLSWKGDTAMVRSGGFEALLAKPVHGTVLLKTVARMLSANPDIETRDRGAPEQRLERNRGFGARVLVAEDNPVNLEVAKEFLGNLGCTVGVAENGVEALRLFTSQTFDLVLMDCQMPEMDGLTAARRIRQHEEAKRLPHTPIIAVTANAFEEDRQACLAAGMDDYLRKPFVEEALETVMGRWLRNAPKPTIEPARSQASAGAGVPAALDEALISRMWGAHKALLARLIETYLNYAPKTVVKLRSQLAAKDVSGLSTGAHSLKSSSANVGALTLSGLCRELEQHTKPPGAACDDACVSVVEGIEREYARVEAALREVQASLSVVTVHKATA